MIAKSGKSQSTSSVNCIATNGISKMNAVVSTTRIMFFTLLLLVSKDSFLSRKERYGILRIICPHEGFTDQHAIDPPGMQPLQ